MWSLVPIPVPQAQLGPQAQVHSEPEPEVRTEPQMSQKPMYHVKLPLLLTDEPFSFYKTVAVAASFFF